VIGATGAVGAEIIACLHRRHFPISCLRLLASERSAARRLSFGQQSLPVEILGEHSLTGVELALFSAGGAISRRYAATAVEAGAIVIDNSSAFRMQPSVPLVVPEVNAAALLTHRGLIANPNCVAAIAATALWPLHCAAGIRRLTLSTYQAASGAGAAAMQELRQSTRAVLDGATFTPRVLRHPCAFNVYSHDSAVDPVSGSNEEETKVVRELRRLLGLLELPVGVTCIRVPVLCAHSIAVTLELQSPLDPGEARALLSMAPGVRVVDDTQQHHFPTPIEATGRDEVLVGRIRRDGADPSGHSLALFVVGDQLLKGAALNAVQIAECLITRTPQVQAM
jgi:aspartate-semialdehyde dehydrogenase